MPESTTSLGGLRRQIGPQPSNAPRGMTKAERLEEMTDPVGPRFPLDEDTREELADYPGPLPRSAAHYLSLLPPLERRDAVAERAQKYVAAAAAVVPEK